MGKHAVIGNSQVGHKSTTLKQASKLSMMERVYRAARLAGPVTTKATVKLTDESPIPQAISPIAMRSKVDVAPFRGLNPIAGDEFTETEPNVLKLRVREGFVTLIRKPFELPNGKTFGVWCGEFNGFMFPLLAANGQALGKADARSKLMNVITTGKVVKRPAQVLPGDKKAKAAKAPEHNREFTVCQVTLEPMRVCEHCH